MPPFLAFSTNCSWAICEFRSVLGTGRSGAPSRPSLDWAQAELVNSAAAKKAALSATRQFMKVQKAGSVGTPGLNLTFIIWIRKPNEPSLTASFRRTVFQTLWNLPN